MVAVFGQHSRAGLHTLALTIFKARDECTVTLSEVPVH